MFVVGFVLVFLVCDFVRYDWIGGLLLLLNFTK